MVISRHLLLIFSAFRWSCHSCSCVTRRIGGYILLRRLPALLSSSTFILISFFLLLIPTKFDIQQASSFCCQAAPVLAQESRKSLHTCRADFKVYIGPRFTIQRSIASLSTHHVLCRSTNLPRRSYGAEAHEQEHKSL